MTSGPMVVNGVMVVPSAGPIGPPGEPGPAGPPGAASETPIVWSGQGTPPEVVDGAKPGDVWLDTLTGDTYELI
ncbi:hypothetical protein CHEID_07155 [Corynebacterium heidelbergense]|nr:hypothetical protein CHEID_07155 [Corynebacterium heidelbergense]